MTVCTVGGGGTTTGGGGWAVMGAVIVFNSESKVRKTALQRIAEVDKRLKPLHGRVRISDVSMNRDKTQTADRSRRIAKKLYLLLKIKILVRRVTSKLFCEAVVVTFSSSTVFPVILHEAVFINLPTSKAATH